MGKRKHLDAIDRLFSISPVVDFRTIDRVVKSGYDKERKNSQYAKLLVSNLVRQGKIKRIGKGCYTKHDDISLAVFCYKPSYLGLQSALSAHNLWEQEAIPIIITGKKARTGIREVMGGNVQILRTESKNMWGFELIKDGDFYLPYSDIEKTVVDMVIFKQHLSPEVLEMIKKKIKPKKLKSYLNRFPKQIKKRVIHLIK